MLAINQVNKIKPYIGNIHLLFSNSLIILEEKTKEITSKRDLSLIMGGGMGEKLLKCDFF